MNAKKIVFIGFQNQDNLGLGYLASILSQAGFSVDFIDFNLGNAEILHRIRTANPLLIGISLIFQYYTPAFANLIRYLRNNGVSGLICAGGHYPSLRPGEVLQAIPELDCIIRFEGELTLLELAQRLQAKMDWHDLPSLAYGNGKAPVETSLRPLIEDLDALPYPERWGNLKQWLGIPFAPILASRGCLRDCSFCSIRQFYSIPPGSLRRTRSVENVLQEMIDLGNRYKTRIFLFQDDDFPLASRRDREWATEFVHALRRHEIANEIIWKINCRSDEVEPGIFADLQKAGLFGVYLGIESGNAAGLQTLNKHISVEANRRAIAILKELGLTFEFGFMLFDPSSTVEHVLENTRFLRDICGDGCAPIPFCKMLPYAGTDIEKQLRQEGRLLGSLEQPDYNFLDPRLTPWYGYLQDIFQSYIYGDNSLLAQIRVARFELDIIHHFHPQARGLQEHSAHLTNLIASYNHACCDGIEDSAPHPDNDTHPDHLRSIRRSTETRQKILAEELLFTREKFFALNRAG